MKQDEAVLTIGDQVLAVETWLVDAATAAGWLELFNTHNRNVSSKDSEVIAGSLRRGEWVVTGETIVFDELGVLVDGQHRLKAIKDSGVSAWVIVVRGVQSVAAQEATGAGRRRTLNTQLQIRGESNSVNLAAAITYVWKLLQYGDVAGDPPTVRQGLDFLDDHPEIRQHLSMTSKLSHPPVKLSTPIAAALSFVFADIDPDDNAAFWEALHTGAGLSDGDPLLALRTRLITDAAASKKTGGSMTSRQKAALVIKAWNLWRKGDNVRILMWKPGGARPEAFPIAA